MASAELSEDLLILILVLLPPKPIFRFRCVSKTWNSIISTPFFLQSYHPHHRKPKDDQRLLAFITNTISPWNCGWSIMPLAHMNHHFKIDVLSDEFGNFINSSNGLTLWSAHQYKILNPLTGKSVSLPDLPRYKRQCPALVCEKSTQELIASYKVIVANEFSVDKTWIVNTYSSKTSKWTSSALMVNVDVRILISKHPVVVNSIVHWLSSDYSHLIVYDSNSGHVRLIKLPQVSYYSISFERSDGDDDLWLARLDYTYSMIKFWMLPKSGGDSLTTEWILKYTFSFKDLIKDIISAVKKENDNMVGDSVEEYNIWLESFIPGKPHIAVLRINKRLCLYNIESKSVEEVQFHGLHQFLGWESFVYMESFCLSSYAL